jgi:hypothetical protein
MHGNRLRFSSGLLLSGWLLLGDRFGGLGRRFLSICCYFGGIENEFLASRIGGWFGLGRLAGSSW